MSCTRSFNGSKEIEKSLQGLPKNTKLVTAQIYMGQISPTIPGATVSNPNAAFRFDFRCEKVYQLAPGVSTGAADWELKNLEIRSGASNSQSLATTIYLIQFVNEVPTTCHAKLVAASLNGTDFVYLANTGSEMTINVSPSTVLSEADFNTQVELGANNQDQTFIEQYNIYNTQYLYKSTQNNVFTATGRIVRQGNKTGIITPTNTDDYTIKFAFSTDLALAKQYTISQGSVQTSFSISQGNVPAPEDPQLILQRYPSDSSTTGFKYKLIGKAFLANDGETNTAINQFFADGTNVGIDDSHSPSITNNTIGYFWANEANALQTLVSPIQSFAIPASSPIPNTSYSVNFPQPTNPRVPSLADFLAWYYLKEPCLLGSPQPYPNAGGSSCSPANPGSGGIPDPNYNTTSRWDSVVRYANACKIFVISDSTLPFYNGVTTSDANSTTPTDPLFTANTIETPKDLPAPPNDTTTNGVYSFPYDSLSIENLDALMSQNALGSNGVYNCLDIRDYYTATDQLNNTQNPTNYAQPIGGYYLQKYEKMTSPGSYGTSTASSILVTQYNDSKTLQNFNWGNDDLTDIGNSQYQPDIGTNKYPQLFKYDVLVVYMNQKIVGGANPINSYSYTLVRKQAPALPASLRIFDVNTENEISNSSLTTVQGNCVVLRVEERDSNNQIMTTNNDRVNFSLDGNINLQFFNSLNDCSNGQNATTFINLFGGSQVFYAKNPQVESIPVTLSVVIGNASVTGLTTIQTTSNGGGGGGTNPDIFNIIYDVAPDYPYVNDATFFSVSSTCEPLRLILTDFFGNPATAPQTIQISSNGNTNVRIFANSSTCAANGATVSSVVATNGIGYAYIKNPAQEVITLTFTDVTPNPTLSLSTSMNTIPGAQFIETWAYAPKDVALQYQISYTGGNQFNLSSGCNFSTPTAPFTFNSNGACTYETVNTNCQADGITAASAPCLKCSITAASTAYNQTFILTLSNSSINQYASINSLDAPTPSDPNTALLLSPTGGKLNDCVAPPAPTKIVVNSGILNQNYDPTALTTRTGTCSRVLMRAYDSNNALIGTNTYNYLLNISLSDNSNLKMYSDATCLNEITSSLSTDLNTGLINFYVKSTADTSSPITLTFAMTSPVLTKTLDISTTSLSDTTNAFVAHWKGSTPGTKPKSYPVSLMAISGQNDTSINYTGILCGIGTSIFVCSYSDTNSCSAGGTNGSTVSAPCLTCPGLGVFNNADGASATFNFVDIVSSMSLTGISGPAPNCAVGN